MTTNKAESDYRYATVEDAISAWEAKGPTSLTVALMAESMYAFRGGALSLAARLRETFPGTLGLDLADEVIALLVFDRPDVTTSPAGGDR